MMALYLTSQYGGRTFAHRQIHRLADCLRKFHHDGTRDMVKVGAGGARESREGGPKANPRRRGGSHNELFLAQRDNNAPNG